MSIARTVLPFSVSKEKIRDLFFGKNKESVIFNWVLLSVNLLVFSIFILEAVYPSNAIIKSVEVFFGLIFLIEYIVRLWISPKKTSFVFDALNITDVIVILSLFMPALIGNLAILRVVRAFKILRSYRVLAILSREVSFINRHRELLVGITNFIVFLFVMTVIVFLTQSKVNPSIETYLDAFYFTVTTLTTTGFGDIIAVGAAGKILTVLIMIFGVTLFVQLARTLFLGSRIHSVCPDCGLGSHELDATHCKHCGHTIKNTTHVIE